jgi:hypothetical protein
MIRLTTLDIIPSAITITHKKEVERDLLPLY